MALKLDKSVPAKVPAVRTDASGSAPPAVTTKKAPVIEPAKALYAPEATPATASKDDKYKKGVEGEEGVSLVPPTMAPEALVQALAIQKGELTTSPTAVSLEQLTTVCPSLSKDRAQALLPHLNRAMQEAGITTPNRAAAFIAQLAHESGELRHFEELASGNAYEGRKDLGNTEPGDGARFKGRGPIQLTGRANYAEATRDLGIDLMTDPSKAAQPDIGFKVAAWYWNKKGLNALADQGDFHGITQKINGGQNGAADRLAHLAKANEAFKTGLTGGPVATDTTPIPPSQGPKGSYLAGRERLGTSYASTVYGDEQGPKHARFSISLDFLFANINLISLEQDDELQKFAKLIGVKWKKGQPVPRALAEEFMAAALAKRVKQGKSVEAAQKELEKFTKPS